MIERTAYSALMRLAKQFPVVAITGPRQSGKSTLTKYAFPEKKYVSFDDKNLRELAKSNPGDFLKAFPDGLIIDEAQKVPEIFDAVKLVIDKGGYVGMMTTADVTARYGSCPFTQKGDAWHVWTGKLVNQQPWEKRFGSDS